MANKQIAEYQVKITADIQELQNKMAGLSKVMGNLGANAGKDNALFKEYKQLEQQVDLLKKKLGQPIENKNDIKGLGKDIGVIEKEIGKLDKEYKKFLKDLDTKIQLLPPDQQKQIKQALDGLKEYEKQQLRIAEAEKEIKKAWSNYKKQENGYGTAQKNRDNAEVIRSSARLNQRMASDKLDDADKSGLDKNSDAYKKLVEDLKQANEQLAIAEANFNKAETTCKRFKTASENAAKKVDELKDQLKDTTDGTKAFEELNKVLQNMGIDPAKFNINSLEDFKKILQNIVDDGEKAADTVGDELTDSLEEMGKSAKQAGENIEKGGKAIDNLASKKGQVSQLTANLAHVFSLVNGFNLLKRSVREAISTIKELDNTMTETAVVTDFSVDDMWQQLPEYTKRANELGISINSAYEAATLYYQQGLKTNQVIGISNETLKMARIASLDAATATDRMTNAMRGFNMELNETSAQRVNDVYSQLAAITASNVNEISTAMTKTASIANSAGMQFETTAAFLSQIIETTRESAETAGTALKTVIARFEELKKDPSEIGEVDGEIVDANKVETALRSVGVALRDSSGQFRDLDAVFLELAGKWDSLDKNTQRYIATIAAGSRQQSRFIAMMSDYDRTMELVDQANNSAGASTEQFNKTLDSLETKLQKLTNAWDSFTMSLVDNKAIKTIIDALTKLLDIINSMDSFGKIATSFVAFEGIGAFFRGFLDSFNNKENGGSFLKSFGEGIKNIKEDFIQLGSPVKTFIDNQKAANETYRSLTSATSFYNFALRSSLGTKLEELKMSPKLIAMMTREEASRFNNAIMTGDEATATEILNVVKAREQKGIFNFISAKLAEVKAKYEEIVADWQLVGANTALLASSAPLLIITLLIVAAIALLVIGIIAVIKQIKTYNNLKPEKQLETMTEHLADAKEQVDNLNTSLTDLNSTLDDLSSKYTNINALAKGTQEWKDAVNDINDTVYSLLQENPELYSAFDFSGDYITIDKNGGQEKIDQYVSNKEEQLNDAKGVQLGAQIAQNKAKLEVEKSNIRKEILNGKGDKKRQLSDTEAAFASFVLEGFGKGITNANGEFTDDQIQALTDFGWSLEEAKIKLQEYNDIIERQKQVQESYNTSLRNLIIDSVDVQNLSSDEQDLISGFNNNQILNDSYSYFEKQYDEDKTDQYIEEVAKKLYGEANVLNTKEENGQYIIKYLDEEGKQAESVLTPDGLKEEYIKALQLDSMEKATTDFVKVLRNNTKITTQDKKNISKIINTKEGGSLNRNDIEQLGDKNSDLTQSVAKTLTEIYNGSEEIRKQYGSVEAYIQATVGEQVKLAKEQYQAALSTAYNYDNTGAFKAQIEKIDEDVSYSALSGLSQNLVSIFESSGIDGVTSMVDTMNTMMSDLAPEQKEAFVSALNTIDWENLDSIESLEEVFDSYGLDEVFTENKIKDFKNQLEDLSNAANNVNFETLIEDLKKVSKISLDVQKDRNNRQFDEDTYKTLISLDGLEETDFVYNLDSGTYDYIGENTQKIVDAIAQQTDKILGFDQLQGKIDLGEAYTKYLEANPNGFRNDDGSINREAFSNFYEQQAKTTTDDKTRLNYESLAYMIRNAGDSVVEDELNKLIEITANMEVYASQMGDVAYQSASIRAQNMEASEAQTELNTKINEINTLDSTDSEYQTKLSQILGTANGIIAAAENLSIAETKIRNVTEAEAELKNEFAEYGKVSEETLEKYNNAMAELSENVGFEKSQQELQEGLEAVQEFLNDFKDLETDADKVGAIQKALDELGIHIDIDNSNFQEAHDLLTGIMTDSEEAYYSLLNLALQEFGITITGEGDFSQLLTEANLANEEFQRIIQELIDAGMLEEVPYRYENEEQYMSGLTWITDKNGNRRYAKPEISKMKTSGYITMLQPKKANSVKSAVHRSGGGTGWTAKGNKTEASTDSSSSSSEPKTTETDYDWLYNLTAKINKNLHERNLLEKEYAKLLRTEGTTTRDLLNNLTQQYANLLNQQTLVGVEIEKHKEELDALQSKYSRFSSYYTYDPETNTITQNTQAIQQAYASGALSDDEYKELMKFLKELEESQKTIEEDTEELYDIEDQLESLKNQYKQTASDLLDRIADALVTLRQREIDKLSDINESINDVNSNVIKSIQNSISQYRQNRELQEKEASIEKKQRKIQYLKQDTSGANKSQIMQLQEELDQEVEDYTDSLIDQAIQEMEQSNEKASEQRQKQIDLMEDQLELDQEIGKINRQAIEILEASYDEQGNYLGVGSPLHTVISEAEKWDEENDVKQDILNDELQQQAENTAAFFFMNPTFDVLTTKLGDLSSSLQNFKVLDSRTVGQEIGSYVAQAVQTALATTSQNSGCGSCASACSSYCKGSGESSGCSVGTCTAVCQVNCSGACLNSCNGCAGKCWKSCTGNCYKKCTTECTKGCGNNGASQPWLYIESPKTNADGATYKTGGLADFTGPAWLDGTKSRPEIVLNQTDSQTFMEFRDLLREWQSSGTSSSSIGTTYVSVDVNAELSNDYDVDQLVARIKQDIAKDASYRNTNVVNLLR